MLRQLETRIDSLAQAVWPGDAEKALLFKASYIGVEGFTAPKLQRMQTAELDLCRDELSKGLERVQAGVPISQALVRPLSP